ncbi:MAG: ABC transporter ATP-binding protein [Spirochaetota bacterium]
MSIYRRLLTYSFQYKYRILTGIVLSFFVSILNGASLTSMIPIFDSLSKNTNYKFQLAITKRDKAILAKKRAGKELSNLEFIEYKIAFYKSDINYKFAKMPPRKTVLFFIQLVFPIYLLKLLCLTGTIFFINSTGFMAIRDLRLELYQQLQILPLNFFVKEKTGILMSRVINDVDILAKIISSDLKDAINDFFYIVTHLILLLVISWKMFLVVFVVVPVIMGPISAFAEKIRKATKNQQQRLSELNGHLQEVLAGIRVIRAFSMEKKEAGRFQMISEELSKRTFMGHFYHQLGPAIIEFSSSIISAIFLAYGAYLIAGGSISQGMFMAFFFTLAFIMRPLKQMSIMFNLIQSSRAAGQRVFEILDMQPDITNADKPIAFTGLQKEIRFEKVSYKYPDSEKYALQNVNLTVKKGETIALVGESGAGKSTLAELIPRFIDPSEGCISFDGEDIRKLQVADIRRDIAVVSQHVFLFNASIRDNIAYGSSNVSEEQIIRAAEEAYAMEFITEFEHGLDTLVGERGVMLSGGQRQRISIARALILDPDILVLDEATSALDNKSEMLVQKAFESLEKDRTSIIIAHRLSTIKVANKICYVEGGNIVEKGTHEELIQADGKYKQLYDLQFAEQVET